VLRDQLGAGQMAFEIKKISNYGTQHPVVARLKVQTHELVQWADLSDEEKGQVKILYFGLADRLLKCYEVYNRLTIALKTAMEEVHQSVDHRIAGIPHLIGLQGEAETFLYESKNYLRDLLRIINIFFDKNFNEASVLYKQNSKNSPLIDWSARRFGPDDPFTTMLIDEQRWVEELIRKRNSVEHPGGKSGVLHIENFKRSADGRFVLPCWYRNQNEPFGVFSDLETYLDNLLTLAEDMLISCIHHRTRFPLVQFIEIPVANRQTECPQRISVQIDHSKISAPVQPVPTN
jgi:hypothetical protein